MVEVNAQRHNRVVGNGVVLEKLTILSNCNTVPKAIDFSKSLGLVAYASAS